MIWLLTAWGICAVGAALWLWVNFAEAEQMGWKIKPNAGPKPPEPVKAKSDTGAPIATSKTELPANPLEWPSEIALANPERFKKAWDAYKIANGQAQVDPWKWWHDKRKGNGTPAGLENLASLIVEQMKR